VLFNDKVKFAFQQLDNESVGKLRKIKLGTKKQRLALCHIRISKQTSPEISKLSNSNDFKKQLLDYFRGRTGFYRDVERNMSTVVNRRPELTKLEEVTDENDPAVKAQRKENADPVYGLYAKKNLSPGTLLGEYTGLIRFEDELNTQERQEVRRYDMNLDIGAGKEMERWSKVAVPKFPNRKDFSLFIDASKHRSEMAYINDIRPDRQENTVFVSLFIHDWPHVVVMTTREVRRGQQLLIEYGNEYWSDISRQELEIELDTAKTELRQERERNQSLEERNRFLEQRILMLEERNTFA